MSLASPASAFSTSWCNGERVKLSGTANYYRNTPSIPTGSQTMHAYFNAIDRWNDVGGMANRLNPFGTTSGSTITHGDGRFDAAVVNRNDIGGNAGLTKKFYNLECWAPGLTKKIIEADVLVANDLGFTNPAEDAFPPMGDGRGVFMHEFGHALGLNHFQAYNVMRSALPQPLFGGPGSHVDVLPDDAQGGRALYPISGTHRNIFASAFRHIVASD